MMGSTNDPEDGKSVAATIFGAVIVYIVRAIFYTPYNLHKLIVVPGLGFPRILLRASMASQSTTVDDSVIIEGLTIFLLGLKLV